jgi:hypothetical protein
MSEGRINATATILSSPFNMLKVPIAFVRSIGSTTILIPSSCNALRIVWTVWGGIDSELPKNKYSSLGRYNKTGAIDSKVKSAFLLTFQRKHDDGKANIDPAQ